MSSEILLCSDTEDRLEEQIGKVGKDRLQATSDVIKTTITTDEVSQELFCQRFIFTGRIEKW